MQVTFSDAHALATDVLIKHGVNAQHARIVSDHLVDAAAAGHAFAGLPRVLAIVENLKQRPPAKPITVTVKSPNSAVVCGGGTNGYVTSLVGIDKAIELAVQSGVGVVGITDTWFSGRLAYYVERAARKGFIAMHTANTMARVAPSGGIDRIFGTNPVAFAFPADPDPLVVDFGTGMTTWGDVLLRQKLGKSLEPDVAVDLEGRPTVDPTEALDGAFMPWGGHRGYGLSLVVQVLGILCGSATIVEEVSDCGFFFLVFNPELLMPLGQFRASVTKLIDQVEASRPAAGISKVRVPGRSSAAKRREAQNAGTIEVDDAIFEALDRMRREHAEA
ncbi:MULTISPECIES: Ldh family oxidoreductase [unclassified Mesorhizobium]|uniref:Ldh family oxidoreductase n=1 Tax=unclassified Mesorhizobium TaxID=325217 RepID=UPI000FD829AC|nr:MULTISPECIES: Ldh family oxidoreductase [unclassified Mesorhizobium]TGR18827.1 Ldh family oxidoreductase [Mesorhizobium sp. M8A.F.Ca.ET.197.01.1.1]TGR37093.1 Ldh family oxidoreductase [bacterium M00.F.Ca.ET.199.01.1.1]TGR41570.1 Ldh family oxidoreductase [Mesorhizobium sp. M8A.F.Ca.ET.198.01.1.1]TGV85280.1 Ldh family oxidoreductase [Mesorhizobium sp. M00.F.Ca.ET.149.01.1.1]